MRSEFIDLQVSLDGRKFRFKNVVEWPDDELCLYGERINVEKYIEFSVARIVDYNRYQFYVFDGKEQMESAFNSIPPWKSISKSNLCTENIPRVLTKSEWNKRTIEYITNRPIDAHVNLHQHQLTFQEGVVARFRNVHKETNTKTLKLMFGLVAAVNFVEIDAPGRGYVRFKNHQQCNIAVEYFKNVCILQKHKGDLGTLNGQLGFKHKQSIMNGGFGIGISLELLSGKDEQEYWQWIKTCQAQSLADNTQTLVEQTETTHMYFSDTDEEYEETDKKRKKNRQRDRKRLKQNEDG